jgi:glutamate/tyrosine decarboxylase-like PLP-dependent enzyme
MEGAGVSHLEVEVLRWFADWLGFPPSAGGVLVTGGSAANLTALACAREGRVGAARADAIAYVSDQSHSSVARAARILGFLPEQVRILPVDDRFRLRPDVLAAAISADRSAGLFRCWSPRRPGRRTPGRSTRWRRSPTSAPSRTCGCTSTARTVGSRR